MENVIVNQFIGGYAISFIMIGCSFNNVSTIDAQNVALISLETSSSYAVFRNIHAEMVWISTLINIYGYLGFVEINNFSISSSYCKIKYFNHFVILKKLQPE